MAEQVDYVEVGGGSQRSGTGSFLGSLATFAVAAATVGAGLRFGSKAAASYLTKRFSGVSGKTLGEMGTNYLRANVPKIMESTLARDVQAGKTAYQKWSSDWALKDKLYSERAYSSAGARFVTQNTAKATSYEYSKMAARTVDFFKKPGLQSRAIGFTSRVLSRSVEGNFAAYIADQAINIYNRREQPDNPSWWNLPGHALGFAKFSMRCLPFDMLLFGGGLKYAAKMGAEAGIGGLKVARETLISQKTTEAALHKVGQGIEWITRNAEGMEAARRQAVIRANQAIPISMGAFGFVRALNPKVQGRAVAEFFRGGKEGWDRFHTLAKQTPRQQFGQETMALLSTAASVGDVHARENFLRHHYTVTQSNKLSAVEYILGLKRKVNFTSELKAAEESAISSLRVPGGVDADAAIQSFRTGWQETAKYLGKRGVQVESGFYSGIGGRTIDLRMLTPQRIRNTAARMMNDFSFNVPLFGAVHPFQYLMIPRLVEDIRFNRSGGSQILGRDLKVKSAGKIIQGAGENSVHQRPIEEGLIKGGIYTAGAGESVYSAGSYYHLADGTIRRLTNPRVQYKLFAKSGHDIFADTASWLGGHYPMKREVEAMQAAPGRPFIRRLLDKFDLGVTRADSLLGRMSGWARQFSWDKGGGNTHPKQIYANIRAIEAGVEGTTAGSVYKRDLLESLDSAFMLNINEGSWLKNKEFRDSILPAKLKLERDLSPNNYKILVDQARDATTGGLGRVHPLVERLAADWNLDRIFEEAGKTQDYVQLGRLMTSKMAPGPKNVHESLLDIISLQSMVKNNLDAGGILKSISETSHILMSRGSLTEIEAASLRVTAGAFAAQHGGLLRGMLNEQNGERIGNLISIVKGSAMKRDIETTMEVLTANPLKGFDFQDQSPYASTFEAYDMVRKEFRNSTHTAVPWKASGRMSTKELEELGLAKHEAGVWPKNETGQEMTRWKFMYGLLTRRFARLFDEPGAGFYLGSYTGEGMWRAIGGAPTQLLIQGVVGRRAGLIAGAALAYTTLDNVVDAMPGLQNTPLGQGITPFLGDQLARFRLGVGMLADVTGVTSSAKYLEGLFPGMIDSPLMRAARGIILPVWAANKIGFAQGRAGKSMAGGLFTGLAMGAVQGFGMFDLTKNTAELKDIYSGREEVPYRKGRWWEACLLPGAKVVTSGGYKNIEDIRTGDEIVDGSGNICRISAVSSRDVNEEVVKLIVAGSRPYAFGMTKDHLVRVARNGKFKDVPAGKVKIGDMVCRRSIPITDEVKRLDLASFGDFLTEDAFVSRKQRNWFSGKIQRSGARVSRFVNVDRDLGFLIGHFLAEGNLASKGRERLNTGIEFACNETEIEVFYRLNRILQEKFGVKSGIVKGHIDAGRYYRLRVTSGVIGDFFYSLLYWNKDKYVPYEFFKYGREFLSGVTSGMFYGDGTIRKSVGDSIYTSARAQLAEFFREAQLSLGIRCGLDEGTISSEKGTHWHLNARMSMVHAEKAIENRTIEKVYASSIDYSIWKKKEPFELNGVPLYKVVEIQTSHYEGPVYDICVPSDHYFNTAVMCIHNSSSNFDGGRIRAFLPNWYSRLKAQHMANPEGLGGPIEQMLYKPWPLLDFNPIGFLLGGRYHYAYNHMYSRPFPESNTAFAEMPFIGPAVASTLGRIIAPPKVMHKEELYESLDRYGYATTGGYTQRAGFIPGTSELAHAFPVSPHGIRQEASRQLFNAQQAAGLPGFAMQTATSELMGFEQPFDGDNVLENAGEITSMRRQYYDMELGGLAGQTELWRRFLPKRSSGQSRINPLQNRMPRWLPIQHRLGDAMAQVPYGELVLPGKGYSSAHDVNMSYPVSADILGLSLEDTVRRMLSLGRPQPIGREEVQRANARIQAAAEVYEPYNDISGTYDGIVRKGRQKILQKIKNLDSQDLTDLIGPTETDISETNFYMRMAGVAEGVIQYRIDGVPIMAYPVRYDEQRFQKDLDIVDRARRKAADLYAKGVGFEGESYSHIDRARILANVSPYSNEFKREYSMAKKDVSLGRADREALDKIKKQRDAMMRSQDFYPRRFLGKVMTPDAEYNSMSINENIKAAANYSLVERIGGALWEGFNSLNHPFDKFHSYKTPIDAYKANTLYGRNLKMWDAPASHWADAYARGFMSKDDPMTGYLAGFLGGYTFGPAGPAGGILGGVAGAAYGAVHGTYRKVRGNTYIPGTVNEIRNISRYFDSMTYYKNMMMYDITGEEDYLEQARSTMAGITPSDLSRQSWKRFYRATSSMERPYTIAFLKETDPHEREEITKVVPEDMAQVLRAKWAKMDGLQVDANISKVSMDKMPPPSWNGWSPEVNLEDVELRTVQNEGYEAHDFGLGWKEQMRRIRNSPNLPGPINMGNPASVGRDVAKGANQGEVRKLIEDVLGQFKVRGFVTVAPSYHDNSVTVIGD